MTPNHSHPHRRHGKRENAEQIAIVLSGACILAFALAAILKAM